MKKIVIYARYSSDRQTEQSIEGQLRVCHEYVERNDYVVVHEYIDRALSGSSNSQFEPANKNSNSRGFLQSAEPYGSKCQFENGSGKN